MGGLLGKVTQMARGRGASAGRAPAGGGHRPFRHGHRGPVTPATGGTARGRSAGGGLESTIRRFMRRGH